MGKLSAFDVEGFDETEWDIRREGWEWRGDVFDDRIYKAPRKIEFRGGIFMNEADRLTVLAMLLENLGIDKAVRLGNSMDWRAALADLDKQ